MDENKTKEQLAYWEDRARGDATGLKDRIKTRFFRTGFVGVGRLAERMWVSRGLSGRRILDVGCGDGAFMAYLTRGHPDKEFAGIDFSPEMIRIATGKGFTATVMNACRMDFGDRSFDSVYAVRAVKNVPGADGQAEAVREMCRIAARRVIIFDTFVGALGDRFVPKYNYPLGLDHLTGVIEGEGFRLLEKRFFPSRLLFWKTVSQQVSPEGFLLFERESP